MTKVILGFGMGLVGMASFTALLQRPAISINSNEIQAKGLIVDGVSYVPASAVSEALGGWTDYLKSDNRVVMFMPRSQVTKPKFRDTVGAISPEQAKDWAVRAKAWLVKSETLMSLINTDAWSMSGASGDEYVVARKSNFAALRRLLDATMPAADQLIDHPYSLSSECSVNTEISELSSDLNSLSELSADPSFKGGPGDELNLGLIKHSTAGAQLLSEHVRQDRAIHTWYEQVAGEPSW